MPEKEATEQAFNPAKYHMNFCHECHGLGKIFNNENLEEICKVCGGFRLIKKQDSNFKEQVGTKPGILDHDLQ